MARLFLHVGGHKTGTSYIQGLFHQNRDLLRRHGVDYPPTHPYQAHHQLARLWVTPPSADPHQAQARSPEQMWQDVLSPERIHAPDTIFLSSEIFSHFTQPRVDMAGLAERLSMFDEIRVIYVMRAQTELINSAWIERVKKRSAIWPRKFVEQTLQTRRAFSAALDHNAFYAHLLTGFAPEQIVLVNYHTACKMPGGLGQWFLDQLQTGLNISELDAPSLAQHNISPDAIALWLAAQMHRDGPPPAELVSQIADIVYRDQPRPSTILSEVEYARVRSKFREGNSHLVQTVRRTQPDFGFEPPPAPSNLLYRNQVPAHVWPDIAAELWARRAANSKRGLFHHVLGRLSARLKPPSA